MSLRITLLSLTWIPVVYTFTNHIYQPYQIRGNSMSPTFNPGIKDTSKDIVLVNKFKVKEASFDRGDVIMFRSPNNPEKILTKRIVGLQGDTVNPKSPPYPKSRTIVPRNHLWVEGDNSFHSIDSNTFGPISQGLVLGKVVTILWPLGRFGSDISGGRDARENSSAADKSVKSIGDI